MTRLPDAETSRAAFIGTSRYENENLEDLPAVVENLKRLPEILASPGLGWLAPDTFTTMLDAQRPVEIYNALEAQAQAATDTLLVYYAGHGALNRKNELYLCPSTVRPDAPGPTALAYQEVRCLVADSRARCRIVVLDCCFSGRAVGMAGEAVNPFLEIEGTHVLTATTRNEQALAPAGQPYTAFTGALIDLLTAGIPEGPPLLTLAELFPHLRAILAAREMPRPWQQGSGTIGSLGFVRNAAGGGGSAGDGSQRSPAPPGPHNDPLPSGPLNDLVRSSHAAVRSAAEVVLGRWLTDSDPAKVQAAHQALFLMAATDASAG